VRKIGRSEIKAALHVHLYGIPRKQRRDPEATIDGSPLKSGISFLIYLELLIMVFSTISIAGVPCEEA
jgi:hypothetical protein